MDSGLTRRCGIQSLPGGRESVAKVWQLLETEAREGETGSSVIGTKTMTTGIWKIIRGKGWGDLSQVTQGTDKEQRTRH